MLCRIATPVVVCLHGLGRSSADWDGVRPALQRRGPVVTPELPRDVDRAERIAAAATPAGAILVGHSLGAVIAMRLAAVSGTGIRGVVLSSSFFPPALNGRSLPATVGDYARHRLAFVRGLRGADRPTGSGWGTVRGLGFLVRTATRAPAFRSTTEAITSDVLVLHAADDHYVPLDFALAAVARRPAWEIKVLDRGGHYPQVSYPTDWLDVVVPWLERHAPDPQ